MMNRLIGAIALSTALIGAGLPASAQTAVTPALDSETITGARSVTLPTPPVTPAYFTLPMDIQMVKDGSITTNTPITDKMAGQPVAAWVEAIKACSLLKPALVRKVSDQEVPFTVGDSAGTVKLNANDKPVCPA
jgi:hypothetical protein